MRLLSIGRSSDNHICLDDPYVGRHHCQIVQHNNGTFTIVDLNSTNGTFVNGIRIHGEVQLRLYDTLTVGHSDVSWMSYFTPKLKSYVLPIVLGCVGGVLLTIVLTLLFFRSSSDEVFAFKGEYPDSVVVNMVDEDGTPYTIEAIEGQICVWFKAGATFETARKGIKASGGKIVAQIPEKGYYLVKVPANKVEGFLKSVSALPVVDWAYPNMLSYPCKTNNYVLDNFYSPKGNDDDTIPHGVVVQHAFKEFGSDSPITAYNIGNKNGKNICNILGEMCINSESFALDSISMLPDDGPIIINMSYGPSLPERKNPYGKPQAYKWAKATNEEKEIYRVSYLNSIKKTVQNLKPLEGKDYVVVIAAGNEGVKTFDEDIISFLRGELTPGEKEILDGHFLLVAAEEKKEINQFYSNEMESGHFDPWVTKVDISDFVYDGKRWLGTSFAAPRIAGILSSVANEKNLTGAQVLQYARLTTLLSPDHSLTIDGLLDQIAQHEPSNRKTTMHAGFQSNDKTSNNNRENGLDQKEKVGKQARCAWPYDYSFTIPYTEDLFLNKRIGTISLPNGDVIKYQYIFENDIWPEYYIKFTMANDGFITNK